MERQQRDLNGRPAWFVCRAEIMTDNLLQTIQQVVQDVMAPDLRELKVRVASLEMLVDIRFDALGQK